MEIRVRFNRYNAIPFRTKNKTKQQRGEQAVLARRTTYINDATNYGDKAMESFNRNMMVKGSMMAAVALLVMGSVNQSWAQPFSGRSKSKTVFRQTNNRTVFKSKTRGPQSDWSQGGQFQSGPTTSFHSTEYYHGNDDYYPRHVVSQPERVYRVEHEYHEYRPQRYHAPVEPTPAYRQVVHHDWHQRDFHSIDDARRFAVSLHLPKVQIRAFKQNGSFHIAYWRN